MTTTSTNTSTTIISTASSPLYIPTSTTTVHPASSIQHVSIKPPPFSPGNAAAFFHVFEAQFHLAHITTKETRFFHALAALPPEIISRLSPTILNNRVYTALKASVLSTHEATKPELFEQLISPSQMTGRPSQFLAHISKIANNLGVGDEIVKHKFLCI